jgi:hypothetical protein
LDAGLEYFLLELAEQAQKALRVRGLANLTRLTPDDFRASPYRAFDQFLDAADKVLDGGRFIFLLDEFELLSSHIIDQATIRSAFNYMRSLIERRPSVAFILAGTLPDRIVPPVDGGPLLALARSYELTYLDREQTTRLIREPVKPHVQYDDDAVEAIWALTHGHPYFTQADLWDDLSPEEQIVFSTLSDRAEVERSPATLREIQAWCQRCIDEAAIVHALGRLAERHLIETSSKRLLEGLPEPGYTLTMALMGRWAGRKHPLGALLRRLAVTTV